MRYVVWQTLGRGFHGSFAIVDNLKSSSKNENLLDAFRCAWGQWRQPEWEEPGVGKLIAKEKSGGRWQVQVFELDFVKNEFSHKRKLHHDRSCHTNQLIIDPTRPTTLRGLFARDDN